MSAPMISPADREMAGSLARMIGQVLRVSRERAGLSQYEAAKKLGMRVERMRILEAGAEENIKLGSLAKTLRMYGLSIAVVREERAS